MCMPVITYIVLYIVLEIVPSCRDLNSLEEYFVQNCSSSILTMCKSQITKIAHHEIRVPKNKFVPSSNCEKKFRARWRYVKNYLCAQWRLTKNLCSQRVKRSVKYGLTQRCFNIIKILSKADCTPLKAILHSIFTMITTY